MLTPKEKLFNAFSVSKSVALLSANVVSLDIPLTLKPNICEPDIDKLPVKICVSSKVSPNWDEPLLNITVDCVSSASIRSAVSLPPMDKSSANVKLFNIEKLPVCV